MTTNFLACKDKCAESDGETRALKEVMRILRRYINDQNCLQKEAVERLRVLLTADGDDLPSPLTVGLLNPGYEFICFGCFFETGLLGFLLVIAYQALEVLQSKEPPTKLLAQPWF